GVECASGTVASPSWVSQLPLGSAAAADATASKPNSMETTALVEALRMGTSLVGRGDGGWNRAAFWLQSGPAARLDALAIVEISHRSLTCAIDPIASNRGSTTQPAPRWAVKMAAKIKSTATAEPAEDQGGKPMTGQYEIAVLLGEGGIGQVHAGFDTVLKRDIAIKSLRP